MLLTLFRSSATAADALLQEDGFFLLQEDGSRVLLDQRAETQASSAGTSTAAATGRAIVAAVFTSAGTSTASGSYTEFDELLQEDGFFLLQEDGFRLRLDSSGIIESIGRANATSTAAATGTTTAGAFVSAVATAAGQAGSYLPLRGVDGQLILDVYNQPIFLTAFEPVEWDSSYNPNIVSPAVASSSGSSTTAGQSTTIFSAIARQNSATATVTGVGSARIPAAFSVAGTASVSGIGDSYTTSTASAAGSSSGIASAAFVGSAANYNYADVETATVPPERKIALVAFEPRTITISQPWSQTPDDEGVEIRAETRRRVA